MRTMHILAALGALALANCQAVREDSGTNKALAEGHTCNLCEKPIPPGKEVTLITAQGDRRYFRCAHCGLTAQASAGADSVLEIASGQSGAVVRVRKSASGWSAEPASAVFMSLPEEGGECMARHQAFPDQAEFERYLGHHPDLARHSPKAYTIAELSEILSGGLPADHKNPDSPVQLLVVGRITHLPFKQEVLPEIEKALESAGSSIGIRYVDASTPVGTALLEARGITEHLPVAMFLNGRRVFEVEGRTVDLKGFPGGTWTGADLALLV